MRIRHSDDVEPMPQYESSEDFAPPSGYFCASIWIFYYWRMLCMSRVFEWCPRAFYPAIHTFISFWYGIVLFMSLYWKTLIVVITPFALLPIIQPNDMQNHINEQNRCLYVLLLVGIFWSCEALPLPVTSMLPIVLFPTLGIMSASVTCMAYVNDASMRIIGGMILALAVQYSNLHKRLALKVISVIGCSQRKLNFGLIAVTMFVSMWISNAAAIYTIVPIIHAVLEGLEHEGLFKLYHETNTDSDQQDKKPTKITIAYFMGAAYATSIGGCGSIQGSGTNLAFKFIYETKFDQKIDYLNWIIFNVPLMLINTLAMWLYLQWNFLGMFRPQSKEAKEYNLGSEGEQIVQQVIIARYKELGPISQHEIQVGVLFIISMVLYFLKASGYTMIDDATTTISIVITLFVLPRRWDWLKFFIGQTGQRPSPSLITWKYVNTNLPWSLLFLLGGGFALANGGQVTGMSEMLGSRLAHFAHVPFLLLLFLICLVIQIITEFVSSVAIVNVILPVLAEIAIKLRIHPLYLMYPATLSSLMGFHTLFGSPHNLVAAEVANISSKDIFIAGFGPSIVSLITIWLAFPTWGIVVYPELQTFPEWAMNQTIFTTNVP